MALSRLPYIYFCKKLYIMKQLLTIISIVCLQLIIPGNIYADDNNNLEDNYTVLLHCSDTDNPNNPVNNNKGNRIPQAPLYCNISIENGISINRIDTEDIISFEIYDCNGILINLFDNQWDFISTLYSMNGEVIIKLLIAESSYTGSLYLTN